MIIRKAWNTKKVVSHRKSKNNRQFYQTIKDENTNDSPKQIAQQAKDFALQILLKTADELEFSRMTCSSYYAGVIHRFIIVID